MAVRRTSVPERIAGDILGFGAGEQVEESQSVLAKYFPELSLKIAAKSARGGRLGRAQQTAEQTIKYTPKEMIEALAPAAPTPPPATPAPTFPDYSGQFTELRQTLQSQSQELASLRNQLQQPKPPAPGGATTGGGTTGGGTAGGGTPGGAATQTPEQQATGVIKNLYKEYLGREPEAAGLEYWTKQDTRAAGGITPYEETQLRQAFEAQPEAKARVVGEAYKQAFGREADQPGLEYWSAQKAPGADIETVKQQLIASAKQAAPTSEDRVRIAYREALGREADEGGLKYWSQAGTSETDFEKFKSQLRVAAGLK